MGSGGYGIGEGEKVDKRGEPTGTGLPWPQNCKFQYLLEISSIFTAVLGYRKVQQRIQRVHVYPCEHHSSDNFRHSQHSCSMVII